MSGEAGQRSEGHLRSGDGHQSLESTQHLIVGSVIWDLVRLQRNSLHDKNRGMVSSYRVHVSDDGSDSRQPSPSSGNYANVLVRVLADLPAPVSVIVEVCDSFTEC